MMMMMTEPTGSNSTRLLKLRPLQRKLMFTGPPGDVHVQREPETAGEMAGLLREHLLMSCQFDSCVLVGCNWGRSDSLRHRRVSWIFCLPKTSLTTRTGCFNRTQCGWGGCRCNEICAAKKTRPPLIVEAFPHRTAQHLWDGKATFFSRLHL